MENTSRVILVTGCSTGIGRAAASASPSGPHRLRLRPPNREHRGSRLAGLPPARARRDQRESMTGAVRTVLDEQGHIDALVNNAGYSLPARSRPSRRRHPPTVRDQVFGRCGWRSSCCRRSRRQRGRIVNIGSMGGTLTFPGWRRLSRDEVCDGSFQRRAAVRGKGFGIDVVLVQPGLIRTEFSSTAWPPSPKLKALRGVQCGGREVGDRLVHQRSFGPTGRRARLGRGGIEQAITDRRPRARMRVTPSAALLMGVRRILSDRQWDRFVGSQFPQPKPEPAHPAGSMTAPAPR